MTTEQEFKNALVELGISRGMTLEVHCSLSSFGKLEGGAMTVIDTLKELVTEEGSIFMPALRLSKELPLTDEDKNLGITVKIKILAREEKRTAMGLVADTFRSLPDTFTGNDVISTSGWGKHGKDALTGGLDYAIRSGGKALLLGVDIYKLTAMHYAESSMPEEISRMFAPTEKINGIYPPDEWFVEAGSPPKKAWYTIQEAAYKEGLVKEAQIGKCKAMFFDILPVISIYERELKTNPFKLWGLKKNA